MELLIILVALVAVVAIVAAPLRGGRTAEVERRELAELADLQAAKEAKYAEIRDAELEYRTGKLSEADWRETNRALRAEAIQLLRRIDALRPAGEGADAADAGPADLGEAAADDAADVGDGTPSPRDARVG